MKTNKMFKSANTLHSGAKCAARLVSVLPPGSTRAWARTACAVLMLAAGLTAGRAADYAITTNGNAIVVTDVSGNSDTLTVSEPGAGFIRFAATPATRTFSVNGGAAITGDSGDLALAGVISITVNTGAGDDTNDIGAFAGTLPSLTINGGTGDDSVNFNGDITFAANASLDVNLQNDAPTPGVDRVNVGINANLITSGSGAITLRCSRSIEINSGASLQTEHGAITLEANQQTAPTAGEFRGVAVLGAGARVTSTGAGIITVRGRGGIGNSTVNFGIHLGAGGLVSSTGSGSILLDGRGGSGLANDWGVAIDDATTQVTSANANIVITGQGGGGGASGGNNLGVRLLATSIAAGGSGMVTVQGTGGTGSSSGVNVNASRISSAGGNVQITGQGGGTGASDSSHGVIVQTGSVVTNGGGGTVTVVGTGGAGSGDNQFGVFIQSVGTQITSAGGNVQVTGQGGGTATGVSGGSHGVNIQSGGVVTSHGGGTVTVQGTGGKGTGHSQLGVIVQSVGSKITSAGGLVQVTGQGGGTGTAEGCFGVNVAAGGMVTNDGSGTVMVQGTAGNGSGVGNGGVLVQVDGSSITSHGGNVQITGIEAGAMNPVAIVVRDLGTITTAAHGGDVTLIGNSMQLAKGEPVISAQAGRSVTLRPYTAGVGINLGAMDDITGGPLSLTDAELDRITAGTIVIGDTNSGAVTLSAPMSPALASALRLVSGSTITDTTNGTDVTVASLTTQGNLSPGASPGIFSVVGNHTLADGSTFTVEIGGTTPGSGAGFHDQLSASGSVNIGENVTLSTVGFGGFVPVPGQSFTIVSRTGGSGTFAGLAEGATVSMSFLGSGQFAHISYVGGTGDDVVLTVDSVDYLVTTNGNAIVVTDVSGNSDTLTVSRPAPGFIQFSATPGTRTFSGSATPGVSASIPLAGFNSITVNAGAGADTIDIGGFNLTVLPSLTINGGTGDDTVNLLGNLTFAANANLDVNLQNDDPTPGVDAIIVGFNLNLITTGSGAITLKCSRNILINNSSSLQTVNGGITLEANQQAPATAGEFRGVHLDSNGARVTSSGTGPMIIKGRGGNGAGAGNTGIYVFDGALVNSTGSGPITLDGAGGTGSDANVGVEISSTAAAVTTVNGDIHITGHGGTGSSPSGIKVAASGEVTSTGLGTITLDANSMNFSSPMTIRAQPGSSVTLKPLTAGVGINLGAVGDPTGGPLSLSAAELNLITAGTLVIGDTNSGPITVSAPMSPAHASALSLVSSGTIADTASGTDVTVASLTTQGNLSPGTSPGIFSVVGNHTIAGGSKFTVEIGGGTPGQGSGFHDQLSASGSVTIGDNVTLSIVGFGGFVPVEGQSFAIVSRTGGSGTFAGLAEGATVSMNFLGSGMLAHISYVGGTGDDVVLVPVHLLPHVTCPADIGTNVPTGTATVVVNYAVPPAMGIPTPVVTCVPASGSVFPLGATLVTCVATNELGTNTCTFSVNVCVPAITVTSTNDSGPGSLRQAIADLCPGGTITFAPALAGSTIGLTSDRLDIEKSMSIVGPGADRLTVSGNNIRRLFRRVFVVDLPAGEVNLSGLTIADGYLDRIFSEYDSGAGVYAVGEDLVLTLRGCTITNCSAPYEGGGMHFLRGNLNVVDCSFVGNRASYGGALSVVNGVASISNSTFSANRASGSAIQNFATAVSTLTLADCTVSENLGIGSIRTESFGLLSTGFGEATTRLMNTLVSGGVADGTNHNFVTHVYGAGTASMVSLGHNLDSDGTSGFTNGVQGDIVGTLASPIDAKLGPLQNNGGPTATHALLAGSPALNAGDPAFDTNSLAFDQRGPGFPRVVGGHTDIGAFEKQEAAPLIVCPAGIGTNVPSGTAAVVVNYAVPVTGNPTPVVTCVPASGSPFPVGATLVTCVATNELGTNTCTFSVTVCPIITVTSTNDSGPGSLRQAIADICPGGAITFAPALSGQTIVLTNGQLQIFKGLSIVGLGADRLTISGNHAFQVFTINSALAAVNLSGLTITDGGVGGIGCSDTLLSIRGCSITNCRESNATFAGGLSFKAGTLTIVDSTIAGNRGRQAGALNLQDCVASISNCTISANFATGVEPLAGAIGHIGAGGAPPSMLTLSHCTVTGNRGGRAGIATFPFPPGTATTRLVNTLVADNVSGGGDSLNFRTEEGVSLVSLGYNLDSDGTSGFTNGIHGDIVGTSASLIDAKLGPLQNNGGPTPTHALLSGSPALNAGDPAFDTNSLAFDQRGPGFPRVFGGRTDIGAFEYVEVAPRIVCPADIGTNILNATDTVVVPYAVPSATGIPTPVVTCVPASGSAFPVGTNLVTCVAANQVGTNTCAFTVTICLPTITVTSTNDSGPGSLRQAIADLCPGGTITFAPALAGSAIVLTTGQLFINKGMSIVGLGADRLKVSGNLTTRAFEIRAPGAVVNLSALTISDGNAGSSFGGGLLSAYPATTLNIRGCTITNCAGIGAGVGFANGTLTIVDSSIVGNRSDDQAGALQLQGSISSISNCTISANTGRPSGAGIILNYAPTGSSTLTLAHCTVNENVGGGGGIWTTGSGATTRLVNTLVSGNTTDGANHNFFTTSGSSVVSLGHNLDSDGTSGFTNGVNGDIVGTLTSLVDAKLGPLANNGGPTVTRALLSGSPALNSGDNVSTNGLAYDQRGPGFPRLVGTAVDIGAFEVQDNGPACLVNWKFDEASGLTVLDSSGNNILGRLTNGPIRTNGVLGRAVRFDGSNDRVQATNSNSLNVTGAFTVACWVRPENVSDYHYFLIKGNDQDERFAYALRSANAKVEYRWVNPAGIQSAFRTTTSVLAVGRWTHVAVAHAPGSAPTIFINGVAVPSSLRSDGGSASYLIGTSPNPFCVGASADNVDRFKGTIDEVFVCLTKLTAGQIRNLTNGLPPGPPPPPPAVGIASASPLSGGTIGAGYSTTFTATGGTPGFTWAMVSGTLPGGLTLNTNTGVISGMPTVPGTNSFRIRVRDTAAQASEMDFTLGIVTRPPCLVHWKFDETNGATALDSSGNGVNGTLLNGPIRTNGQVNRALRFDGSNDRVNGGNPSSLNYTGAITLAAWIRPESISGTRMVVIKGELDEDDFAWALGFTDGKLQYRWVNTSGNDSIYQSATVVLASGRWTHIAGVHTPGSAPRLYTNGVLVAGSITTGSGTANIGTTSKSFTVGSSSDGADRFLGSIDEVFVCRSALNTTSLNNLMAGLPPDFNPAAPLPLPLPEPSTGLTTSPLACTLRVFDGVATISWPSVPGLIYRGQFKNSLEETEWQDLAGDIYPPGEAASVEDAVAGATQRFYRVIIRP